MNTTTKAEQNALTLPQRAAVALGAAEHEVKLRELVKSSADIVVVIDPAGREQAHRIGMTLKNARVAIEKTGKAAREDATAFSKAVIAEEKRLVSLITPEEDRVLGLRDTFDAAEQARKDAEIAAERARVEAIEARIQRIRNVPLGVAGKSSGVIGEARDAVRDLIISEELYGEQAFRDKAMEARSEAFNALEAAFDAAEKAEADARAAEEARRVEAARIDAERAELAKLRAEQVERERIAKIESDRITAEQAAEAKRLAEAQRQLELIQQESARIAAAEQAERERVAAETKRQLDEQQAKIAADRQAFLREQEEARERAEAAEKLAVDHTEALAMNVEFDAAFTRLADATPAKFASDDLARCKSTFRDFEQRHAASVEAYEAAGLADIEPTDSEIIDAMVEAFGMDRAQSVERLARFDVAAARAQLAEAA